MPYKIGVDIGGAFTDLVAYDDETGESRWMKGETTPKNPSIGVTETIKKSKLEMSEVETFIHGQTLVINSIIERKGAKVGLITTRGYRDCLELQRSNRRDMYNFRYKKPVSFVPRYLRLEVDERIMGDGTELTPLNAEQVKGATEKLLKEGVESICISFLNSYANPEHELEAREMVRGTVGEFPITLGHEITREWREYERTNTAVLNSYVLPKIRGYLDALEEEMRLMGFRGKTFAMLSNGGMATFDFIKDYPIYAIESGPVAGVMGGVAIGELLDEGNIITLDGGSTTTKTSLVESLTPRLHSDYYIERDKFRAGYPVKVPVVDTEEVGNGGTSMAWIDDIDNLRVGPQAMGADPGPACYGKGGKVPTVTDAYAINGLINPNHLLGGEMEIYRDLAVKAVKEKIADRYEISPQEAAEGIIKLANENAANAIRVISVQRGYDPRDFTLVAYGGSGPMFAPFIAGELEMKKIIIPAIHPGVFSAWGMLLSDIKHDLISTNVMRLDGGGVPEAINGAYEDLEEKLLGTYKVEGADPASVVICRFADMRYLGQEHTVKVPIPTVFGGKGDIEKIMARFHQYHEREYSFRLDSSAEIVNFHVTGIVKARKLTIREIQNGAPADNPIVERREVYIGGTTVTLPVIERARLHNGAEIDGPAIVEDPTSTILVLGSQRLRCDKYGNMIIVPKGGEK